VSLSHHKTEAEFLELVAALPSHLRALVARHLWWGHVDRTAYDLVTSARAYPDEMPILKAAGRHFEIDRPPEGVFEDELRDALISCGYRPDIAAKRAKKYFTDTYHFPRINHER